MAIVVLALMATADEDDETEAKNDGDTARTYIPYPDSKMLRPLSQRVSATHISATSSVLASVCTLRRLNQREHGFTFGTYLFLRFSGETCSCIAGKYLRYRAGSCELLVLLQSERSRCFFSLFSRLTRLA